MRFSPAKRERLRRGVPDVGEVTRTEPTNEVAVLNHHEVRLVVVVVEEARQPRVLRNRSCSGIGVELVRESLLQTLDVDAIEARDAPEQMKAIWRRL